MASSPSNEASKSVDTEGTHSLGSHESQKQMDNDRSKTNKPSGSGESQSNNCYCGKERNLNIVELLCAACSRWFHESCISYQLGKLVPFMTNYYFICKNCSPSGLESFKKSQASFTMLCLTAIANLKQESVKDGTNREMFSKDTEIIPFLDQYWEAMTTMPRRVTQSWYATVQRALLKDAQILFAYEEDSTQGAMYGINSVQLTAIKPNYEAMVKQGQLKLSDIGVSVQLAGSVKGRQGKRRPAVAGPVEAGAPVSKKGRAAEPGAPKLSSHGYPSEHPFNKDGYRYILAEPDPHAPFRQEFDENNEWSGKPIPGWLYRSLCPGQVLLALHDRAPQLRVSDDRRTVTGEKGYCMVRATHGVSRGTWYWEAYIEELAPAPAAYPGGAGATRIGWGRRYANLQAPLGYDDFGYSWRSRMGTAFHKSTGKHYSDAFGAGDTLGFLIVLPESTTSTYTPNTYKDRPLVKFKSHLYYEDKDNVQEAVNKLKVLPGSKIYFFRNGVCQGEAFTDLYEGCYYPSVSVYRHIVVHVNFGPHFKYPPVTDIVYRPMSDRAEEAICEQTMADLLYLTENEGKLRLDNYNL